MSSRAWLVRGTQVLASAEVAQTFGERARGLLRRDGVEGVLVLGPARSIHTLGMRFTIDVAWCDDELHVLRTATVRPWRVTRPVRGAALVIEAEAGALERWGVAVGDHLALRTGPS